MTIYDDVTTIYDDVMTIYDDVMNVKNTLCKHRSVEFRLVCLHRRAGTL